MTVCLPRSARARPELTSVCAGASALDTMTPAMGPGMMAAPPSMMTPRAGPCSGPAVATTPAQFSDMMGLQSDNPKPFLETCPSGSYVTAFLINSATAAVNSPVDDRVYSIQAQCNDAARTLTRNITLTAPVTAGKCGANFTASTTTVNFTSNSDPPAFWNVYYR